MANSLYLVGNCNVDAFVVIRSCLELVSNNSSHLLKSYYALGLYKSVLYIYILQL